MMRKVVAAAATIVLLTAPALGWAQSSAPSPAAPSSATSGAPSGTTSPSSPTTTRTRQTLQQRFDAANTTNDGHLTKDQAAAAHWTYVSRNFDAIDKTHQGFVTTDDIRSYAAEKRAARKAPTANHS